MQLFTGTHLFVIDDKNRVSLPADYRSCLGDRRVFYLFPSPFVLSCEACSAEYIGQLADNFAGQASIFSAEEQVFNSFFANAVSVLCDSTGRFILPEKLAEHCQITKQSGVVFAGAGYRFQIWNEDLYKKHCTDLPQIPTTYFKRG